MTEEKIKKIENCKYRLPCGWCDRLNDKCIFEQSCEATKPSKNKDNDFIKEVLDTQSTTAICIHEWEPVNSINTAGYVYRCRKCGTMKTEPITRGLQEYITTTGNEDLNKQYSLWNSDMADSCKHCSNHPSNGGSGICHCTLGQPPITCLSTSSSSSSSNINSTITATNTLNMVGDSTYSSDITFKDEPEQLTFNFKE